MRTAMLVVLMTVSPIWAQEKTVTPKVPPPPKARMTPAAPKIGDLLMVDASSAKGAVAFEYDLPSAMTDGKKLFAAVPVTEKGKAYSVRVIYWEEKLIERITFNVAGTDEPAPADPNATPVQKLEAKVDALTKVLQIVVTRLDALEKNKPPVTPPPPPIDAVAGHVSFVAPEKTPTALAINNDAGLRTILKSAGIKVHLVTAADLGKTTPGFQAAVNSTGTPCVVIQDEGGRVIGTAPMSSLQDVTKAVTKFIKR